MSSRIKSQLVDPAKCPCPSLYEALAHHGDLANGTEEALVVPRQLLEGYELGAAQTTFA